MVPLPLLQQIGRELVDCIDQNAQQSLRKTDFQRTVLDLFADAGPLLTEFQGHFEEMKELEKKRAALQELASKREREEDLLHFQIEEIEKLSLKKGEEEALFEEYGRLANSQEIGSKIEMLIDQLSEGSDPLLFRLSHLQKTGDSLLKFDASLESPLQLLSQATICLSEALHAFQLQHNQLENDPRRLEFLETRLSEITRLKRKYGNSFEEIDAFHATLKEKAYNLTSLEEEIEKTNEALESAKQATSEAVVKLTETRKTHALHLQTLLTTHLNALNMPGAEVEIEVLPQARHLFGEDLVQFWIRANAGEHPALVKEHSSGGEVSRLLFAIKLALAEKNDTPTLLFDEIDANVGGETASLIGEKLKELGQVRQVICITHFPQVAWGSNDHFCVQKVTKEGRTLTEISHLDPEMRSQELLRMVGGKNLFPSFTK